MHAVMVDQIIPPVGQSLRIVGDEAAHTLRVKRMEVGETVRLLDGAGVVAHAEIHNLYKAGRQGQVLEVRVISRMERPYPGVSPCIEVFSATPKGGRVDEMIDGLSQVGAAEWRPLDTERGIVDPRESKLARIERIAIEAAKQCGRSWVLRIGTKATMDAAITPPPEPVTRVLIADVSGAPWPQVAPIIREAPRLRVLIGPEGGWSDAELAKARTCGAAVVRFGPHTMRIEQAAVAACAIIMSNAVPECD